MARTAKGNSKPEGENIDPRISLVGDANASDGASNEDSGDISSGSVIDPGSLAGGSDTGTDTGTGTGTRRRGRPRGSRNGSAKRTPKQSSTSSKNLESILLSAHTMLAVICKTPELALSEDESKQLADAVERVNSLYDFSVVSEEAMAWINLAMVGGSIYGPRYIAANIRKRVEKAQAQEESNTATVVVFPNLSGATPPVN